MKSKLDQFYAMNVQIRFESIIRLFLIFTSLIVFGGCTSTETSRFAPSIELRFGDAGKLTLGDFDLSKNESRIAAKSFFEGDRSKAIKLLMPLAEQGDSGAQNNLGLIEEDRAKSLEWFQKAAAKNHASAKYSVGLIHWLGLGAIEKDEKKGAELIQESAEQGYDPAQFLIGLIYDTGSGVPQSKDRAETFKWMNRAASQGNFDAACFLGNSKACAKSRFFSKE